jgi:hypothetical protein
MLIIALGSHAIRHYDHLFREPKDFDVVISYQDLPEYSQRFGLKSLEPRSANKFHGISDQNTHHEIEVAGIDFDSSTDALYKLGCWQFGKGLYHNFFGGMYIPPLELLYHIKMCHRHKFSPHFDKTWFDISYMRNVLGIENPVIKEEWQDFMDKRTEECAKKTPNLKGVKKDEFFLDTYGDVDQIVHDTIHLTQALDGLPAYTRFQKGEVECCMKTFFEVDEQVRLNAVFEESATLAIERAIWPSQFKCDERKAFVGSLQRVCCHITSGRFREYAWENYNKVLAMYENGAIIGKFKSGIENGTIKFQKDEKDKVI